MLTLTRENALLLLLPILLWIALAPIPRRARVNATSAFVAACLALLLPVGIRNLATGGGFHLTTAQFGPNFYIGNHAGASGTYEALAVGRGSAADEQQDATRLAEQGAGQTLTASEVSTFWANRAWSDIRSQPIAWLRLLVRKTALTFNAAEIADTETLDVYAEWSALLRMLRPFDFGVLLAVAALGALLTAMWRRLWLLYAVAATYAVSVVLFYVFARYRFASARSARRPSSRRRSLASGRCSREWAGHPRRFPTTRRRFAPGRSTRRLATTSGWPLRPSAVRKKPCTSWRSQFGCDQTMSRHAWRSRR